MPKGGGECSAELIGVVDRALALGAFEFAGLRPERLLGF
jgi:hypothetical protein